VAEGEVYGDLDFDEVAAVERMRMIRRRADRAQALGLKPEARAAVRWPLRVRLGRALIALGSRLGRADKPEAPGLSPSQCFLR
jgi:hypothetical protein